MTCPARLLCQGIIQARILEWVAIPFFRESSQPRDWTWVSCTAGRCFTVWGTQFSSVAQLCLTLWSHGLHAARQASLSSPTPRACSNSCPSSRWCLQSFPVSESFPTNQFFASGGQSIGVSASASVLPMNIQDRSPLSPWGSQESSPTSQFKVSIFRHSAFFMVQLSHPYMTTGKTIALTRGMFVCKVMSLLFNMLSRLVITFPSRSKHLLISWLQSPSAVILEPPPPK